MIIIDTINQTVTIDRLCIVTKKEYSVTVPLKGYNRWIKGEHIHTAMPEVSAEDREFLISSTSPEGWDILFPEEEETKEEVIAEDEGFNMDPFFLEDPDDEC